MVAFGIRAGGEEGGGCIFRGVGQGKAELKVSLILVLRWPMEIWTMNL